MDGVFAPVLVAAQFVFHTMKRWAPKAVLRLLKLSGKLSLKTDRDGTYILLRTLSAASQASATLSGQLSNLPISPISDSLRYG
ncbi:MAG: hypothetical protein WCE68_08160 [Anaerolineales bacterium]